MKGFYYCKACNIMYNVLTYSRNRGNNKVRVVIPFCPHCKKEIKEISEQQFNDFKPQIWLNICYDYVFRHVGKRKINMTAKYGVKKE